jgi:hypothetical protein
VFGGIFGRLRAICLSGVYRGIIACIGRAVPSDAIEMRTVMAHFSSAPTTASGKGPLDPERPR